MNRWEFLKIGGLAGAGLFLPKRLGLGRTFPRALPGGALDPIGVTKYASPLLIPPVMPKAGTIKIKGGKNADYYEISMRQFQQQILPAGLPATTVWGYGAVGSASKRGLLLHNAPSLTIEANWNAPVRVKWINELMDANGNYLPHLLPVDPTLHWANPPGGIAERDMRPIFTSTPGPYTGPIPMVTHVHGAVGVGDESDGYAGRRGTCPRQLTSPGTMRLRAPGTTSSRPRPRWATAPPGGPASPPSSTRTRTALRPSGTTTTRWA